MKIALHLGLGDHIACSPIIAKLASEHERVIIPSWAHNVESVKSFYVNHPNVEVIPYETNQHNDYMGDFADAELKLGIYSKDYHQFADENFVLWFFRQAGMSQEERWKWCPIQKASEKCFQIEQLRGKVDFIHQDRERGFYVRGVSENAFHVGKANTILNYVMILKKSRNIHCIDSSFLHLAEAVETNGKLFYHQYARPNSTDNYQFRKQWTTIK